MCNIIDIPVALLQSGEANAKGMKYSSLDESGRRYMNWSLYRKCGPVGNFLRSCNVNNVR